MKRILHRLAALALSAALLTGCQAAAPAASSATAEASSFVPSLDTSTTTTIEVRGSWSNFEALDAIADDWNQIYPNVAINYTKVDEYNKHLADLLDTEDRPDLVVYGINTYYADKDTVKSHLVDLNTLGLDTSVYAEDALNLCMDDGKMLALNWGMQAPGFIVNKTLLESLGLNIPQTHEEFTAACKTLREAGYVPLQGCYINVYSDLVQNDRNLRLEQEEDHEALYQKFSTAEPGCGEYFAPEFETLFTLLQNGDIDHKTNQSVEDIYQASILHFFEGNCPFFCTNAETVSGMKKRESKSEAFTASPFEYEFVSLPVENDTPALSISALDGLALVSGSKNEAWGAEFLRFVCSEEELNKLAQTKGVPALTQNRSTDPRFAQIAKVPAENRVIEADHPVIQLITVPYDDTMWDIAEGNVSSVEEAEADFEARLADWLSQQS